MTTRRGNPALSVLLANPRAMLFGTDVQAVLYRHAEDGENYAHTFGGADAEFLEVVAYREVDPDTGKAHGPVIHKRRSALATDTLRDRTGVEMRSVGDSAVVLSHKDGKPISREL